MAKNYSDFMTHIIDSTINAKTLEEIPSEAFDIETLCFVYMFDENRRNDFVENIISLESKEYSNQVGRDLANIIVERGQTQNISSIAEANMENNITFMNECMINNIIANRLEAIYVDIYHENFHIDDYSIMKNISSQNKGYRKIQNQYCKDMRKIPALPLDGSMFDISQKEVNDLIVSFCIKYNVDKYLINELNKEFKKNHLKIKTVFDNDIVKTRSDILEYLSPLELRARVSEKEHWQNFINDIKKIKNLHIREQMLNYIENRIRTTHTEWCEKCVSVKEKEKYSYFEQISASLKKSPMDHYEDLCEKIISKEYSQKIAPSILNNYFKIVNDYFEQIKENGNELLDEIKQAKIELEIEKMVLFEKISDKSFIYAMDAVIKDTTRNRYAVSDKNIKNTIEYLKDLDECFDMDLWITYWVDNADNKLDNWQSNVNRLINIYNSAQQTNNPEATRVCEHIENIIFKMVNNKDGALLFLFNLNPDFTNIIDKAILNQKEKNEKVGRLTKAYHKLKDDYAKAITHKQEKIYKKNQLNEQKLKDIEIAREKEFEL